MIDTTTQRPLRVSKDGDAGPYIMVPVAQIEQVRSILDAKGIPHWVDAEAISLDGKPAISVINLGRSVNVNRVQELLDNQH
jgi:hypothetical protein